MNKTVLQYVVTNITWSFYSNSRWSWFILERSRSQNIPLKLTEQKPSLKSWRKGCLSPVAFASLYQRLSRLYWVYWLSYTLYKSTVDFYDRRWHEIACLREILKVPKYKRAVPFPTSYFYWFASRYCDWAQHSSWWQMYAKLVRKKKIIIQSQVITGSGRSGTMTQGIVQVLVSFSLQPAATFYSMFSL